MDWAIALIPCISAASKRLFGGRTSPKTYKLRSETHFGGIASPFTSPEFFDYDGLT